MEKLLFFFSIVEMCICVWFFFSSRRRHTRLQGDWSSDVCSSDLDAARPLRIVLDGGADARHMDVDRAVEGFQRFALDEIHQRLPREHAARLLGERHQQGELMAREAPLRAVDAHRAGASIDLEPTEA